jgi:hypothetical protein
VNALTLAPFALGLALLVGVVALVRRGRAGNRAWTVTIAEHVETTGDYPTVAEWRTGRLARRPTDPQPQPRVLPAGPAVVTVTVVDTPRAELPGGVG